MEIVIKNNSRILIIENGKEVSINDGDIIQYNGIYYKMVNDIVEIVKIETTFIGIVETTRSIYNSGIQGIYVKPIYIWNIMGNEWKKNINLHPPKTKYFLYPHLLVLSKFNTLPSCYYPLYFLDTCENKSLDNFINIQNTFCLSEDMFCNFCHKY